MLSIKQGIEVSSYPLSRHKMFQQILQNFKSQKKRYQVRIRRNKTEKQKLPPAQFKIDSSLHLAAQNHSNSNNNNNNNNNNNTNNNTIFIDG